MEWFSAGEVEEERDGWISDARLRRLFATNIELGYEWRDECTEMILVQNYRYRAYQMKRSESTHERRKFFHELHNVLDDRSVESDYRGMKEVMFKARQSGVVTNLGIWEFEHLDEDGGTKEIERKLKAGKDIFMIPAFGLTESPYNWRTSDGQPFYRGVGTRPAAEKYVHLALPTWQAFLRKRYRLEGWKEATLDDPKLKTVYNGKFELQYDPKLEQLWKDEEDAASWWWWGTDIKSRDKETKRREKNGEHVQPPKFQWELDELAVVKPTFKMREEFMPATYNEESDDENVDEDEKAAKLVEEQIAEAYQLSDLFDKPVDKIDLPAWIVNLISARERVHDEPFMLSSELQGGSEIQEAYQMFGQRESLVLEYLDLKTPQEDEPPKSEEEIKAWLMGKLEEFRAESKRVAEAKAINRQAWEANELQKVVDVFEARRAARKAAQKGFGQLIVERTKAWVPFL